MYKPMSEETLGGLRDIVGAEDVDATQIALMRRIKEDFEPLCILNPGKIFA